MPNEREFVGEGEPCVCPPLQPRGSSPARQRVRDGRSAPRLSCGFHRAIAHFRNAALALEEQIVRPPLAGALGYPHFAGAAPSVAAVRYLQLEFRAEASGDVGEIEIVAVRAVLFVRQRDGLRRHARQRPERLDEQSERRPRRGVRGRQRRLAHQRRREDDLAAQDAELRVVGGRAGYSAPQRHAPRAVVRAPLGFGAGGFKRPQGAAQRDAAGGAGV